MRLSPRRLWITILAALTFSSAFVSVSAQASGPSCESLWVPIATRSSNPKTKLGDRVAQSWRSYRAERLDKTQPRNETKRLKWHNRFLREVEALYVKQGIRFEIIQSHEGEGSAREVLRILPDPSSVLGRQAQIFKEMFDGFLVVDPYGNSADAMYSPLTNSVLMSTKEALTLTTDDATAHEAVHMAINHLQRIGKNTDLDLVISNGNESTAVDEIAAYAYEIDWLHPQLKAAFADGRTRDFQDDARRIRRLINAGFENAKMSVEKILRAQIVLADLSARFRRTGDPESVLAHVILHDPKPENQSAIVFIGEGDLHFLQSVSDPDSVKLIHDIQVLQAQKSTDLPAAVELFLETLKQRLNKIEKISRMAEMNFQLLNYDARPTDDRQGLPDLSGPNLPRFLDLLESAGLRLDLEKIVPRS